MLKQLFLKTEKCFANLTECILSKRKRKPKKQLGMDNLEKLDDDSVRNMDV